MGLDRKVVWQHDPRVLTALQNAARDPLPTAELAARFGAPLITKLVDQSWLQDPTKLCVDYQLYSGEIEVTAHCNWGCLFCPVSKDPKPRETMPMSLFTEIVTKLADHGQANYVTFHFFNEPTLDRLFVQRIEVLREYDMKLALFTNGSALTPDKIKLLMSSGVLYHLIINLPTLHRDEFETLTGARTYAQSLRNLDQAIDAGAFPIGLVVNGLGPQRERNLAELRERYEPRGVTVDPTQHSDRAGTLRGKFDEKVRVDGRLTGCNWPVNHAYYSVRGDMFLCCNDYYQREVFGHVGDGSVHEVMTSPAAVETRRRVFGVSNASEDYPCRSCHDQCLDFPHRQFRPMATFPLESVDGGAQW
ncbi:MAG: radical SAM/SPASM domain-containing protein [Pseudonocardiaceae bacterium]